jgi:hypothetical protein
MTFWFVTFFRHIRHVSKFRHVENYHFSGYFDVLGYFKTFWFFVLFSSLSTRRNFDMSKIIIFRVILTF